MNTSQQKFSEAFSALCNVLGYFGSDSERSAFIATCVQRLHRTTQQTLMRNVLLPCLQVLAQQHKDGWTDLRNERACALAAKMLESVDDADQYVPLV